MYHVIVDANQHWRAIAEDEPLPTGAEIVLRGTSLDGITETIGFRIGSMLLTGCAGECRACPAGQKNLAVIAQEFGGEVVIDAPPPMPAPDDAFWNEIRGALQ